MFRVSVTEERDLAVFVRGRTIGIIFKGPTGADDERHEADLSDVQIAELVAQLPVHGLVIAPVRDYPTPSYDDLLPPQIKINGDDSVSRDWSQEPTVGELGIADPPQLTAADYPELCGNDSLNVCCGGGCHG